MNKPARRLGRGLDALVPTLRSELESMITEASTPVSQPPKRVERPAQATPIEANNQGGVAQIPVDQLRPNPMQPRGTFDEGSIRALADSIRRSGLLQPVAVRRAGSSFEIIAGERRWRAAKLIGMQEIPAIIRDAGEEQMLEFALIENLQREDLNPMDRAVAYRQFCDRFALKPDEVAERVAEDRTTVINYLRILDLPDSIRKDVADGKILMGHARSLVGISNPEVQNRLAAEVVKNDLSVRALEELIRKERSRSEIADEKTHEKKGSPHVRDLQRRFEDALKTRVTIKEGKKKGSGRMVIEYYSIDDFDRIAAQLGVCLD